MTNELTNNDISLERMDKLCVLCASVAKNTMLEKIGTITVGIQEWKTNGY